MAYVMGIDIGTSGLKTMITDEEGNVVALSARSYQYDSPINGYAEQDPECWWKFCVDTIKEALQKSGLAGEAIAGVSFSGQMHGAVFLDEHNEVIRPVILHCDVRSGAQVTAIKEKMGQDRVKQLMMNPVYTGFLLVSLLWVRENEPEHYARIRKVCLPKDYIKYKLTNMVSTDYSDASATLAYDIQKNEWSEEILRLLDIPRDIFPVCYSTYETVGVVSKHASAITGLSEKTKVIAGGGDQIMQGIGNGVTEIGQATANIGSSGQICFQSDRPIASANLSTNTFCGYKRNRWIVMGAIMYAGLSLEWFNSLLGNKNYDTLDETVAAVKPGSGGLIFLPYLNGERTPHANPNLSAMFIGLNTKTGRAEMTRAVMEGVTYALNQSMEICESLGLKADSVVASGGGARSGVWLQMQADVYGIPVKVSETREQACLGAAIAAGVGAGIYGSIEQGCQAQVRYKKEMILPNETNHKRYSEYYGLFKAAYTVNKQLLENITALGKKTM